MEPRFSEPFPTSSGAQDEELFERAEPKEDGEDATSPAAESNRVDDLQTVGNEAGCSTDTECANKTSSGLKTKRRAKVEFVELCETRRQSSFLRRESLIGDYFNQLEPPRRGSDFKRFFTRPRSRSRSRSPSRAALDCQRLRQPRLSLLGKPINYRPLKQRDPRYRRFQNRLNNFLERPRGVIAVSYHVAE